MLSACGGETAPRKEGEKRVGDIIMIDGEFGVVFAVTSDGQHGKVMSVFETECNLDKAKTWCTTKLGCDWRLPTKDELQVIYRKKSAVNSALYANGFTTLSNDRYWSLKTTDESNVWVVNMYNGDPCYSTKYDHYYVRAVSAF